MPTQTCQTNPVAKQSNTKRQAPQSDKRGALPDICQSCTPQCMYRGTSILHACTGAVDHTRTKWCPTRGVVLYTSAVWVKPFGLVECAQAQRATSQFIDCDQMPLGAKRLRVLRT